MRKQVLSLILLAVLIPLVNLGPSLHHLSFFGLHFGCGCEHVQSEAEHDGRDNHSLQKDDVSKQAAVSVLSGFADSDCPLCQFFAHYNAISCQHSVQVVFHGCHAVAQDVLSDPFLVVLIMLAARFLREFLSDQPSTVLVMAVLIHHPFWRVVFEALAV